MKLPSLKTLQQKDAAPTRAVDIKISVQVASDKEAVDMQEAIQSFVSHFSLAEMKSAAQKLKSPANRKMIKTFL